MEKHIILNQGGQIRWISSLRGLLVFFVFFSHLTALPIHKDLMFIIGRIGVAGFFLISGYLAVSSLEKRDSRQFLMNRFFRIYPIYWLLLLITFILTSGHTVKELLWNVTLFEEFAGYEAMIGSAWMLPIMVIFFVMLTVLKKHKNMLNILFYMTCAGSLVIGALRFFTNMPFPTALCLLMCVGLIGYIQNKTRCIADKKIISKIALFEITLIVASALSYADKVYWYFIAYNMGFAAYFLFQKFNISIKILDKLGELGFTFFLGAGIPMMFLDLFVDDLSYLNCYQYCIIKFILALLFSYIVTRWCEKPLLEWAKRLENIYKINHDNNH